MSNFKISPQTNFVVTASLDFANFNESTLVQYYQPILSPLAMGLFSTFRFNIQEHPLTSSGRPFAQLCPQVNAGIKQIDEALHQLEGVRLVKSFLHSSGSSVDSLVCELQPTLTPAEFMKDDLLSVQLIQMVGDHVYRQLGEKALSYHLDVSDLKNVSASFFDVFRQDSEKNWQNDPAVKEYRTKVNTVDDHRVKRNLIKDNSFDMHFLAEQVADQGISENDLQNNRDLILVEHKLYGYDELEMGKLLVRSLNLITNKIDPERLKKVARNVRQPSAETSNKFKEHLVNTKVKDLSSEEKILVEQCERQVPIEFLMQLKQQTNSGFVTSGEKRIVENLLEQTGLSTGAVNLLLWYLIAEQGMATLKANLAYAIANNWVRVGVANSVDALEEIKNHQRKKNNKVTQRGKYHRRSQIKEKLPDWAKDDYQAPNKKASPEVAAKTKKMLEEYKSNSPKK